MRIVNASVRGGVQDLRKIRDKEKYRETKKWYRLADEAC
ncbi:hypothetical protein SAMN06295998_102444 [Primorskyibacter flagellatus]|uniref:Uncharacterized protein n=1 Tax=Primorskyibacter flagellatus TaxID=1387277 RepID=A0A1W2A5R4_9RHOB|nr:hypothetical protein SAMN06295998_102444 [Primorskyibacter flagellatus]